MAKTPVDDKCLVPRCTSRYRRGLGTGINKGSARGLCGRCYAEARRAVRIGQTTWRELEDLGLALAPVRKVTPKVTLFEQALAAARAAAPTAPERTEP